MTIGARGFTHEETTTMLKLKDETLLRADAYIDGALTQERALLVRVRSERERCPAGTGGRAKRAGRRRLR